MAKEYDAEFIQSPKDRWAGDMVCVDCCKPITDGNFLVTKKNVAYDWEYRTRHRKCSGRQTEWAQWDAKRAADAAKKSELDEEYERDCAAFLAKWGSFPECDCYY